MGPGASPEPEKPLVEPNGPRILAGRFGDESDENFSQAGREIPVVLNGPEQVGESLKGMDRQPGKEPGVPAVPG